jgi:hypothetical protein
VAIAERVAPDEIGQKMIDVTLADADAMLLAHRPISLAISYARCAPTGVMLPIVITVSSGSSQASYRRSVFARVAPDSYTFTPREGGPHVIRVAEAFHNRWWGALKVDVGGARLNEGTI